MEPRDALHMAVLVLDGNQSIPASDRYTAADALRTIPALLDERDRYRAALEEMANGCLKWQGGECRELLDDHNTWCCACIAADALEVR